MSGITFANLVLAKTDEERKTAKEAHYQAIKDAPSDGEMITGFLCNCTTETGASVLKKTSMPISTKQSI